MRYLALVAASCFLLASDVEAQDQLIPPIRAGLALLAAGNCDSAFALWAASWVGTADAGKRDQLVAGCGLLRQMEPYHGYDVLRTVDITAHVRRSYLVLLYQKQPVYIALVAYRSETDWNVQTVNWHTDFDRVVPPEYFGSEHPLPSPRQ